MSNKKIEIDPAKLKSEIPENSTNKKKFPVVGIGASAGGLEALKAFFSNVSDKSGMAYIVVVHISPNQPSLLPELLQKITSIPVEAAKDNELIKPDHIYVNIPNQDLTIYKNKIQLMDIVKKSVPHPIDLFFKCLGQDLKSYSAAIILSGTGNDGTFGIKDIKANDGLVLVQSEESSGYNGMPKNAINTGLVDMVLTPEKMPQKLVEYFSHPQTTIARKSTINTIWNEQQKWLNKIFAILRTHLGHDFSSYKENTILRRIGRRMGLNHIDSYEIYVKFLRENPKEIDALFRELLIGVTNFFRDADSFEKLKKVVLPELIEQMQDGETLRAWIPGCSTGEEVYSLAIIMRECLENNTKQIDLQLFGTDIDKFAIDKAREGIFTASITSEVSKDRLKRYFIKDGEFYRIRKELRDCAVFSVQDIIKDPPFSRLNLLCCRNLLIYLNSDAQKKILPLFHYTLSPNGFLMLGSSETIGGFNNLFTIYDKKWKIFKKKEEPNALRHIVDFPSGKISKDSHHNHLNVNKSIRSAEISQITQKIILDQFAPTSILIDENYEIIQIQGRTGKYLEPPSGSPTYNIVDMARQGLRIELSSALRTAKSTQKKEVRRRVSVKTNGDDQLIDLHICPQQSPKELAGHFLVVFQDLDDRIFKADKKEAGHDSSFVESSRIADLEKELQINRESHQTTIEELESSNEELKSTNEELQSANEELQSTNEELESSKEELQSLNEELQTVNNELQSKVEELSAAHDDMHNLLNSTEIATIFLDDKLRIRRFTSESKKIINLIQTDIGRPLKHVVSNLDYDKMISDSEEVLNSLIPKEVEVQSLDGKCYKMRIIPYRTIDNKIDGVVLTFADISESMNAINALEDSENRIKMLLESGEDVISMVDMEGRYLYYSGPSSFGLQKDQIIGKTLFDILDIQLAQEFMEQMKEVADCKKAKIYETKSNFQGKELFFMDYRYPIRNSRGEIIAIATIGRNITELKKISFKLEQSEERINSAIKASPLGIILAHIDLDFKYTWICNPHPDFKAKDFIGKRDDEIFENKSATRLLELKQRVLKTGVGEQEDVEFQLSKGPILYRVSVEPQLDTKGKIIGLTSASVELHDILMG